MKLFIFLVRNMRNSNNINILIIDIIYNIKMIYYIHMTVIQNYIFYNNIRLARYIRDQ